MIDLILWILELTIEWLGEMFIDECGMNWESAYPGFNPGQATIYDQNISHALIEFYSFVSEEWIYSLNPAGVDMSDYEESFYSSYDIDVLERAFMDTFLEPWDAMAKILRQAQALQEVLEFGDLFG